MKREILALMAASMVLLSLPARAEGDPEKGRKVFIRCQACHSLAEGQNRVGPSLHGIVGRKAGSLASFKRYSKAMQSADVVWNEETLDKYLANPRAFVPGNAMAFPGLPSAEDRANLIAFLKQAGEASK
ncbi:MAG: c-type cytochrome [Rhodothalassiaceae bacterium]